MDSWISANAQFFSGMSAQIANTIIRIFVGITVALGIARAALLPERFRTLRGGIEHDVVVSGALRALAEEVDLRN